MENNVNNNLGATASLSSTIAQESTKANSRSKSNSRSKIEKGHFFKELFRDLIGQSWTLLGLVVAYLVLEGSAKALTGNLILITLGIWVLTFPIRYTKREHSADKSNN